MREHTKQQVQRYTTSSKQQIIGTLSEFDNRIQCAQPNLTIHQITPPAHSMIEQRCTHRTHRVHDIIQ